MNEDTFDTATVRVCLLAVLLLGVFIGVTLERATQKPPVTVNFTFTNATPQNVKGLTTAATDLLQKKGVLPGFKP